MVYCKLKELIDAMLCS